MTREYTDQDLLDDLQSVAERLGHTPVVSEYNEFGLATQTTLHNRFGSYNEAVRAAGLKINSVSRRTDKESLLEDIRQLNQKVRATPPRKRDMNERGEHGVKTYQDKFGSWNRAVEEAGFTPRPPESDIASRPDSCRLCGAKSSSLDFHHWRYGEDKIGCYLCRECHDAVHEGPASTQNVDWLPHSIEALVDRHIDIKGDASVDDIVCRYNLPDVEILVDRALDSNTIEPTD